LRRHPPGRLRIDRKRSVIEGPDGPHDARRSDTIRCENLRNLGTIHWVVAEIKLKKRNEYKAYNFRGIMFTLISTCLFYGQKKTEGAT
jgi:hypothetical protein